MHLQTESILKEFIWLENLSGDYLEPATKPSPIGTKNWKQPSTVFLYTNEGKVPVGNHLEPAIGKLVELYAKETIWAHPVSDRNNLEILLVIFPV